MIGLLEFDLSFHEVRWVLGLRSFVAAVELIPITDAWAQPHVPVTESLCSYCTGSGSRFCNMMLSLVVLGWLHKINSGDDVRNLGDNDDAGESEQDGRLV